MLVLNYLIVSVWNSLNLYNFGGCVYLLACGFTLPLAGWLADAHVGWYKVIRCSIWIMWSATVLATVSSVIAQLIEGYSSINSKVQWSLYTFIAIGFGGY